MKKIVIGIIAVLLCVLIFFGSKLFQTESKMNQGYINGNTAGNLYNGGSFCEYNGVIYFSNPNDNGKLYSMDSNGQNLKKISDKGWNLETFFRKYYSSNIYGDSALIKNVKVLS